MTPHAPRLRLLGTRDYAQVLAQMKAFSQQRTAGSADEVWALEHLPVYTLGIRGGREHLHDTGAIPVVATDRGGQVTYHGPGQLVVYPLLDLGRKGLRMRQVIDALEEAAVVTLARFGILARAGEAPGVFVGARKIASIGLRMAGGCCYHGMALNVCTDLRPFDGIDPCGERGLAMTTVAAQGGPADVQAVAGLLLPELVAALARRAAVGTTTTPIQEETA